MGVQIRQRQSLYVVNNLRGVNVTTLNDNKMWVGRSVKGTSPSNNHCSQSHYNRPSPKRERNRTIEIVSKPPPPRQTSSWWNDNEAKRKRRVATYKLYAAEGKLKSSLKKGFRSIKGTCMKIVTSI